MREEFYHNEHETKFIISNRKSYQIIEWLRCNCSPDARYPAETVSSIYYDTWRWRFLDEKFNSDYLKTKVRIRWYSDIDNKKHFEVSFAEAKFKVGNRREKIRIITPYSGKWMSSTRLDNPELLVIPLLLRSRGIVLDENVFPVYQVSYKRMRFIEPCTGVGLCFDYDISAPRVNSYMLPKHNPFTLHTAVFEIKGGISELPYNLHPLTDIGFKKASFSKYSACFQKITQARF
jgi:hypothetical protein